jgi:hypothetical protein
MSVQEEKGGTKRNNQQINFRLYQQNRWIDESPKKANLL